MTAASKNLTPVTLELGGKSPCIVSKKLSREGLQNAANRIAWGKFMNAGQTCIAPDYILVHPEQKEAFVAAIKLAFKEMFGGDSSSAATQSCGDYCRIINSVQHSRLTNLLSRQLSVNSNSKIVLGGAHDLKDLFIEPTIVEGVGMDPEANPLMKDELFGPILPIIEANLDEAIKYINSRDRPLCAYVFSEDKATIEKVLKLTTSGGVCVNDTLMHTLPGELPFGGIGPSGMGGRIN